MEASPKFLLYRDSRRRAFSLSNWSTGTWSSFLATFHLHIYVAAYRIGTITGQKLTFWSLAPFAIISNGRAQEQLRSLCRALRRSLLGTVMEFLNLKVEAAASRGWGCNGRPSFLPSLDVWCMVVMWFLISEFNFDHGILPRKLFGSELCCYLETVSSEIITMDAVKQFNAEVRICLQWCPSRHNITAMSVRIDWAYLFIVFFTFSTINLSFALSSFIWCIVLNLTYRLSLLGRVSAVHCPCLNCYQTFPLSHLIFVF